MMRSIRMAAAGLMAAGMATAASSPVFFLPRQIHASPSVRFIVRGSGLTAFFAQTEVVFRTREGVIRMEFPGAPGPRAHRAARAVAGRGQSSGRPAGGLATRGSVVQRHRLPRTVSRDRHDLWQRRPQAEIGIRGCSRRRSVSDPHPVCRRGAVATRCRRLPRGAGGRPADARRGAGRLPGAKRGCACPWMAASGCSGMP